MYEDSCKPAWRKKKVNNLPIPYGRYVLKKGALEQIHDQLNKSPSKTVVTIWGPNEEDPKLTDAAIAYANYYRDEYHHVWYVNAGGRTTIGFVDEKTQLIKKSMTINCAAGGHYRTLAEEWDRNLPKFWKLFPNEDIQSQDMYSVIRAVHDEFETRNSSGKKSLIIFDDVFPEFFPAFLKGQIPSNTHILVTSNKLPAISHSHFMIDLIFDKWEYAS